MYPFRESTLKRLDEDVSEIRQNISLALEILQLKDASQTRNDVEDVKARLSLVRTTQVLKGVYDWPEAPDASPNHNEAYAKRNSGSGWLTSGSQFNTWLASDDSFLWVYGFAGCGKSVICATAIQHTFRFRTSNPRVGIGFFYFTFSDNTKQDSSSMLRALLRQLSAQLGDDISDITDLHRSCHPNRASVPALLEAIKEIIRKFQDVYIFVDALDESPLDTARNGVLQVLGDIRNESFRGLHILVTNRDLPNIRESISSYGSCVAMKNAAVDRDIADFISDHLQESHSFRKWSAHHDRIKEALTASAHGVFRWVECQFRSLAKCPRSKAALEKQLRSLPVSLDETYERMLLSIDLDRVDDTKRILMLLCFAERPLTVEEIIDGCEVQTGTTPKLDLDCRFQDESDLLQICPGFIEIGTKTDRPGLEDSVEQTVRIAHFSVQEYLESDRICQQTTAQFSMRSAIGHAQLAQICLIYLLEPAFSSERLEQAVLDAFPFAIYAAEYRYAHVQYNQILGADVEDLIRRLFNTCSHNFVNCIRMFNFDTPLSRLSLHNEATEVSVYLQDCDGASDEYASSFDSAIDLTDAICENGGEDRGRSRKKRSLSNEFEAADYAWKSLRRR